MHVCGDTSPPCTAGEGNLINRPPKNGERSEKNHGKYCDSPATPKAERNRRERGEIHRRRKRAKMSGKHSLKNNLRAPPLRGGRGGLCAVCGGAEVREGEAPAGGYGGITKPPARAATAQLQSPERTTNRQNKGTFANDHKNPTKTLS